MNNKYYYVSCEIFNDAPCYTFIIKGKTLSEATKIASKLIFEDYGNDDNLLWEYKTAKQIADSTEFVIEEITNINEFLEDNSLN